MLGLIFICIAMHLALSKFRQKIPYIADFIEAFSGTLSLACWITWINEMQAPVTRNSPSLLFPCAAFYFFMLMIAKFANADTKNRKHNIFTTELKPAIVIGLCSLLLTKIIVLVTPVSKLDPELSAVLLLVSFIGAQCIATLIYNYRKATVAQ